MKKPTDDQYRDAAVLLPRLAVGHDAEVTRADGGAYVTVMVWISAATAETRKEG